MIINTVLTSHALLITNLSNTYILIIILDKINSC